MSAPSCSVEVIADPQLVDGRLEYHRRCKRRPTIVQKSIWGDFPFCTQHHKQALSEGAWVYMPDGGTLFIEASDWKIKPLQPAAPPESNQP